MEYLRHIAVSTFLLLLFPTSVQAVSIDANDYSVGTDVSNAGEGATLQDVIHENASGTISMSPTITESIFCDPDINPDPNCMVNYISSVGGDLVTYRVYLEGTVPEINDLTDVGYFTGISVSFDRAVQTLSLGGFSNSGDGLYILLFGMNDEYLGYQQVSQTLCDPPCGDTLINRFLYADTFDLSATPVYRIHIGSDDAAVYVDNVSYALVPVPPALYLFGSGLLGLVGIAQRKKV